ncbi:hypothetical protein BpHYR1_005702 [Brachionus plicatilis]|uniref:Uncharacterized protein n=1 Tax=Brachionus plicatilis TaxID=10195 RepID=A0A3M7QUD1_BRAPC|nr:hypothetical protein BpHYR1_005702 [Brachionus plicatilis]
MTALSKLTIFENCYSHICGNHKKMLKFLNSVSAVRRLIILKIWCLKIIFPKCVFIKIFVLDLCILKSTKWKINCDTIKVLNDTCKFQLLIKARNHNILLFLKFIDFDFLIKKHNRFSGFKTNRLIDKIMDDSLALSKYHGKNLFILGLYMKKSHCHIAVKTNLI